MMDVDQEQVDAVADLMEFLGADFGPKGREVVRRGLLAARACELRKAADEARHAAAHERASRETGALLDLAKARTRARLHVRTALEEVL